MYLINIQFSHVQIRTLVPLVEGCFFQIQGCTRDLGAWKQPFTKLWPALPWPEPD